VIHSVVVMLLEGSERVSRTNPALLLWVCPVLPRKPCPTVLRRLEMSEEYWLAWLLLAASPTFM